MLIFEFFIGLLIGTAIGVFVKNRALIHPIILLVLLAITYTLAETTVYVVLSRGFTL